MILEPVLQYSSMIVAGSLGILLSPFAAFQQRKISEVEALHKANTLLQKEVTRIQTENVKLAAQVQEVEASVSKVAAHEATLETVNALGKESLCKLQDQLQQSREILSCMDHNYQAIVLQSLMTVLLAIDADRNMILADEEIETLIHNLEAIHGVQLKDDILSKTIIDQGRSVDAVMEVARNVLSLPTGISSKTETPMFSYLE